MKKALLALLPALLCAHALAQPATLPAHYRHQVGDVAVTALFDGMVYLPRHEVGQVPAERLTALLAQSTTPEPQAGLQTAVNAFLLQHDGQTVLVDTGTADCFAAFNPTPLGSVPAALHAAGVPADSVQHVLLTHAHPDHICGLLNANGTAAYPNATMWLGAEEAAYWRSDTEQARVPEAFRFVFTRARAALAPYEAAGKLRVFAANDALPMQLRAIPLPGHTVGHTGFLLGENSTAPLLLWGDAVHFPSVQLALPSATYAMDHDAAQAARNRAAVLQQAADKRWYVAGAHLPFPGLGRVITGRSAEEAFRWVPVEYSPQPQPSPIH